MSDNSPFCPFWADYAEFLLNPEAKSFISSNFIKCNNNFTSFIALCVLDMPFETASSEHQFVPD